MSNPIEPGKLAEMEKAENPVFCGKIPYPIGMWIVVGLFVLTTVYSVITGRVISIGGLAAKLICLIIALTCCKENVCIRCATWILMLVIVCLDGIVLLLWFGVAGLAADVTCRSAVRSSEWPYATTWEVDKDCRAKRMTIFMIWWVIGLVLYFICHIFAIVGVYKWWKHGKNCEEKLLATAIGGAK